MDNAKWVQLINKHIAEIESMGLKQYRARFDYRGLSGFGLSVEMDKTGKVYTVGPISRDSISTASCNGETLTVINFETVNFKFDDPFEYWANDIKDTAAFKEHIKQQVIKEVGRSYYETDEDYEEAINESVEDRLTMQAYAQFNIDRYEEIVKEAIAIYVRTYGAEEVERVIYNKIDQLEE